MKVKDWPQNEKPREKLVMLGAASLSDAELLALLLRSGIRGKDAVALGRELLASHGGFRGLLSQEWRSLNHIRGLGPAKAASLVAVTEISRRYLREEISGRSFIKEPQCVLNYLTAELRDRKVELFKVLFLNKASRILGEKTLFAGTIDQTAVHPREIIREALERNAASLVLVHNHPSGRPEPSREDRELTNRLNMVCKDMSIRILDHLIIADNAFFSFREHGLL